jgi:sugar O-acyltransferase (sialic acid O-acetyltransferase NeuD family)
MKNRILLIGAGGHSKSCIDVIEQTNKFKIVGLVDNKGNKKIYNYKVFKQKLIPKKYKSVYGLISVGQIKDFNLRKKLYKTFSNMGLKFIKIISPKSYVSKRAQIGKGTIIMSGVIINAGAQVGKNCIINTNSVIEHDVIIGDHCHVSTGAIINGDVKVGDQTFIGSGAVIKEGIKIGKKAIISANIFIRKNLVNKTTIKN